MKLAFLMVELDQLIHELFPKIRQHIADTLGQSTTLVDTLASFPSQDLTRDKINKIFFDREHILTDQDLMRINAPGIEVSEAQRNLQTKITSAINTLSRDVDRRANEPTLDYSLKLVTNYYAANLDTTYNQIILPSLNIGTLREVFDAFIDMALDRNAVAISDLQRYLPESLVKDFEHIQKLVEYVKSIISNNPIVVSLDVNIAKYLLSYPGVDSGCIISEYKKAEASVQIQVLAKWQVAYLEEKTALRTVNESKATTLASTYVKSGYTDAAWELYDPEVISCGAKITKIKLLIKQFEQAIFASVDPRNSEYQPEKSLMHAIMILLKENGDVIEAESILQSYLLCKKCSLDGSIIANLIVAILNLHRQQEVLPLSTIKECLKDAREIQQKEPTLMHGSAFVIEGLVNLHIFEDYKTSLQWLCEVHRCKPVKINNQVIETKMTYINLLKDYLNDKVNIQHSIEFLETCLLTAADSGFNFESIQKIFLDKAINKRPFSIDIKSMLPCLIHSLGYPNRKVDVSKSRGQAHLILALTCQRYELHFQALQHLSGVQENYAKLPTSWGERLPLSQVLFNALHPDYAKINNDLHTVSLYLSAKYSVSLMQQFESFAQTISQPTQNSHAILNVTYDLLVLFNKENGLGDQQAISTILSLCNNRCLVFYLQPTSTITFNTAPVSIEAGKKIIPQEKDLHKILENKVQDIFALFPVDSKVEQQYKSERLEVQAFADSIQWFRDHQHEVATQVSAAIVAPDPAASARVAQPQDLQVVSAVAMREIRAQQGRQPALQPAPTPASHASQEEKQQEEKCCIV